MRFRLSTWDYKTSGASKSGRIHITASKVTLKPVFAAGKAAKTFVANVLFINKFISLVKVKVTVKLSLIFIYCSSGAVKYGKKCFIG